MPLRSWGYGIYQTVDWLRTGCARNCRAVVVLAPVVVVVIVGLCKLERRLTASRQAVDVRQLPVTGGHLLAMTMVIQLVAVKTTRRQRRRQLVRRVVDQVHGERPVERPPPAAPPPGRGAAPRRPRSALGRPGGELARRRRRRRVDGGRRRRRRRVGDPREVDSSGDAMQQRRGRRRQKSWHADHSLLSRQYIINVIDAGLVVADKTNTRPKIAIHCTIEYSVSSTPCLKTTQLTLACYT